ncbi:hypothetical protein [Sediminicoccus rosea]|uniref:Uncharacterized protein n=1 Tax=Sediminicoccus rosea TaxID=1225128 RepID=A0ABZ0PBY6_9PROT|nr:hypothetical protein [Sediminicoccus rosea]WPB83102.1 hypothetical protein R9Z33_13405 [Sediminicoccus rosea]
MEDDFRHTVAGEVVALKVIVLHLLGRSPELLPELADVLARPFLSPDDPLSPRVEAACDEWRRRILDGRIPLRGEGD